MDSIIFDVDGTLWNSTDIVARSWTEYLKNTEHIDKEITGDQLMPLFGKLLPDIAASLLPDYEEDERIRLIDACCEAENRALIKECAPLYEGLEETLKPLSQHYPLFIVSNCQSGYIEAFLQTTGFGNYFKGHLCPGDTGLAKGENIQQIVREYQLLDPVYVGDTLGDFQACQAAGVPFIFASYGFGKADDASANISKPADLLTLCGLS